VNSARLQNPCQQQNCRSCVQEDGCVWCTASQQCTTSAQCPFTPYTDCCFTHSECKDCVSNGCTYCVSDRVTSCQANPTPSNGTMNDCATQVSICPEPEPFATMEFLQSFLTGVFLAIGSSFVLLAFILFVIYLWRWHKKNEAEAEIQKLYHEKKAVTQTIADFENKLPQRGEYTTLAPLINKMRVDPSSYLY